MNQFKTFFLLAIMTVIVIYLGDLIGGKSGLVIGLVFAVLINFVSYFYSDKIVLAMYGAQELPQNDRLVRPLIANLVAKEGMPMPKVYMIDESSPNAFATGRDPKHAAVAVTSGILSILDKNELEGVLAHELSHVKNRDILISTIAAVMVGMITFISRIGFFFGGSSDDDNDGGNWITVIIFSILATIAMMLMQMWLSRTREYIADESGANMCGKPWALANALGKLESGASDRPMNQTNSMTENMFIVNPFTASRVARLFSTHPSTEDRIKRLNAMNAPYN